MNFLAHLFLSDNDAPIMVGNFIADSVKGNHFLNYRRSIANGILLHRAIDGFTDRHPAVGRSKQRLRQKYRKYAGVVVDMYYDHFLATNWSDYTNVLLETFVSETYQTLQTYVSLMPERSQRTLYYMQRSNWLVGYATFDGLGRALSGLAGRTRFVSHMEQATCDLKLDYPAYAQDFSAFFPDLIRFSHHKLDQLRTSNLHF